MRLQVRDGPAVGSLLESVTHSRFGEQMNESGWVAPELAAQLRQIHPQIVGFLGVGRALGDGALLGPDPELQSEFAAESGKTMRCKRKWTRK